MANILPHPPAAPRLLFAFAWFTLLASCCAGAAPFSPPWWVERGVVATASPVSTNDYAAATQGQVKWMADRAMAELSDKLTGGAGVVVSNLVASFSGAGANDYAGLNGGQLKTVAAPFYDRLRAAGWPCILPQGMTTNDLYPWAASSTPANDYAMVNLGQVKYAFSFVLLKVEIENAAPRDTDDIQVQYFTNNAGAFTYTAIQLQIYFRLQPDSGWTPDGVELHVKNPAGSTIRTITLPTSVGQQQTTWDGKDSSGNYVANGSNYVVEIAATIGGVVSTGTNALTVYEIRQGNCAYTPFADIIGQYHAAVVYEYFGGNRVADIDDLNKYTVFEHPGVAGGDDTRIAPMAGHEWDYWCPQLTRNQRIAILGQASALAALTIPYVSNWDFVFGNAIVHDDATNSPAADDWAGTFADIKQIRCDGAVEAVYEAVPVRLWGATAWWNVMTPGAQSSNNLAHHNATFSGITPARQRYDNDPGMTQNVYDALHLP